MAPPGVAPTRAPRAAAARARAATLAVPVLAAVAALACAGCAGVKRTPAVVPPTLPVLSLRIDGANRVDASIIADRLATRAPGWWPGAKRMDFDPVAWGEDLRRIVRVYEAEGYYEARVVGSEVDRTPAGVRLHVTVREGSPVRIRRLEVTGTDALPPGAREEVARAIRLREGEVFRERDWTGSRDAVERVLREHGYAEGATGGEARVVVADRAVDVRFEIAAGRRYRFGKLFLATEPDAAVPPAAVLAQARAALPEGAWFSQSALAAAQERIFEMGVFRAVSVTAAAPETGSDLLPVVVEVREGPLRSGRAGAGIGASPGRSEAHLVAEWIDRDLGGDLRSLQARARAGWVFVPTPWDALFGRDPGKRHGPFANGYAELARPGLLGNPDLEAFGAVELETDLRELYRSWSARAETGVGLWMSRLVRLQASAAVDAFALSSTPLGGAGSPEPAYGCAAPCLVPYVELAAGLGRRRAYRAPPQGGDVQLRLRGYEGPAFRGWQADFDGRAYVPVTGRLLVAARVTAGAIAPWGGDEVPVVLRYFGGGDGMRGYGARQLSPRLLVPAPGGRAAALPTGGRSILEASVEARLALGSSLGVAAFLDAGAVSASAVSPGPLLRALQLAPGAGLRYDTPLGPLRLDLAVLLPLGPALPTYAPPGSGLVAPARGGCLGAGGPPCAIQFSLGEAF